MAISTSPPPRKKPTEADIEAVINKGGRPTVEVVADTESEDTPKHINTRLTAGIVREIDALRASRKRKPGSPKLGVSLHDWVVEAVLEKLERDAAPKSALK